MGEERTGAFALSVCNVFEEVRHCAALVPVRIEADTLQQLIEVAIAPLGGHRWLEKKVGLPIFVSIWRRDIGP